MIAVQPITPTLDATFARLTGRLACFALALRRAGYPVFLTRPMEQLYPHGFHFLAEVPYAEDASRAEVFISDLSGMCEAPPKAKKIAVEEFLFPRSAYGLTQIREFVDQADLILAGAWRYSDICSPELLPWAIPDTPGWVESVGRRIQRIPLGVCSPLWLFEAKLLDAYISNDRKTFEERWPAAKTSALGFAGALRPLDRVLSVLHLACFDEVRLHVYMALNYRHPLVADIKPLSHGSLSHNDYMKFLSSCYGVLDLPGDSWACYRFVESVLAGCVPVVTSRNLLDLDSPLTADNVVLVPTLENVSEIAEKAVSHDYEATWAAYCEGWSPLGIMKKALRRIGYER